jgi:large subunit ribosomal protein L33
MVNFTLDRLAGMYILPPLIKCTYGNCVMAKKNIVLIKLVSSAATGFYYVTKKNPKTKTEKLAFRKYDPVARKHVIFNEAKIK